MNLFISACSSTNAFFPIYERLMIFIATCVLENKKTSNWLGGLQDDIGPFSWILILVMILAYYFVSINTMSVKLLLKLVKQVFGKNRVPC